MVRVGEDQAILTLERIHALGVLPETKESITTEPSHRFTGAHQSLFLRLFWLGIDHPLNTSKTAYKRF